MNIANKLTLLRIMLAFVCIGMILVDTKVSVAIGFVVFLLASFTDFLDGYIARKKNLVSDLGRLLDPIADKAMVVIALMVIVGYSSMSPWLVLPATFILFREVFVSGLREFLGDTAGTLKVTKLAKWKTAFEMIGVAGYLLGLALLHALLIHVSLALICLAAALSLYTGALYLRAAFTKPSA